MVHMVDLSSYNRVESLDYSIEVRVAKSPTLTLEKPFFDSVFHHPLITLTQSFQ